MKTRNENNSYHLHSQLRRQIAHTSPILVLIPQYFSPSAAPFLLHGLSVFCSRLSSRRRTFVLSCLDTEAPAILRFCQLCCLKHKICEGQTAAKVAVSIARDVHKVESIVAPLRNCFRKRKFINGKRARTSSVLREVPLRRSLNSIFSPYSRCLRLGE